MREAERWGDEELRTSAAGCLGRAALPARGDGHLRRRRRRSTRPGTDFAIRYVRSTWKYHGITAERLADDLAGLPAKLDHVDALADDGVIGGEQPTAADLQIGATLRVLLTVGDLRAADRGRAGERIARRWFPDYPGEVPGRGVPGRLGADPLRTAPRCGCNGRSCSSPVRGASTSSGARSWRRCRSCVGCGSGSCICT